MDTDRIATDKIHSYAHPPCVTHTYPCSKTEGRNLKGRCSGGNDEYIVKVQAVLLDAAWLSYYQEV